METITENKLKVTQPQWIHLYYSSCIYGSRNIKEEGTERMLEPKVPGSQSCVKSSLLEMAKQGWNRGIAMDMLMWEGENDRGSHHRQNCRQLMTAGRGRINLSWRWAWLLVVQCIVSLETSPHGQQTQTQQVAFIYFCTYTYTYVYITTILTWKWVSPGRDLREVRSEGLKGGKGG